MNKAGLMRIGAMLAVLAVVLGGLAVLPYWTARGQTTTIWGIVRQCGASGPAFLDQVTVTLTDANSATFFTNNTRADGYYSFSPPTGSYVLKFELNNYYTAQSAPFRFDGSLDVRKDKCLVAMPSRTTSITALVVGTVSSLQTGESLQPSRFWVYSENTALTFNTTDDTVTVSHDPIVYNTETVSWRNSTSSIALTRGTDFIWKDPWNGRLLIRNANIANALRTAPSTSEWLNVTYQYSLTTTVLDFHPVVTPPPYVVYRNSTAGAWTSWSLNVNTGLFTFLGDFLFGSDAATIDYTSTGAIAGVSVTLFNTTTNQGVGTGTTNGTGYVTLAIWPASLELQATKEGYQPFAAMVDTSLSTNWSNPYRAVMPNGVQIYGHAFRTSGGPPITTGVVGYLYNMNPTVSPFRKVIQAKVQGSLYVFNAEDSQTYKMVIDADGYKSSEQQVSTAGVAQEIDAFLVPSLPESYKSVVTFSDTNWNQVWIKRQVVLRPDSSVPGLNLSVIRSLPLQIDYSLGNKNGIPDEPLTGPGSFQNWIASRLQYYTTTDSFLTTDGMPYNSTLLYGTANVTVEYKPSIANLQAVYINTTAAYRTMDTPPIPSDYTTYYVNITTPNDTNTTQYQNQSVVVDLPHGYEMVAKKVKGTIKTYGYTTVTVDPGLGTGTSEIDMTVRRSKNGTARAAVTGPAGNYHVFDDSDANYTAVVSSTAGIAFSAAGSTDPVGDINNANFTWRFEGASADGWGMAPTHNYSLAGPGRYVVNLTVTQAGGNVTYRDIVVFADNTPPIAVIGHNKTSPPFTVNANGTPLSVSEGLPVRFDGTKSTDLVYPGATLKVSVPDVEGNRGYSWDFNGDGIADSTSPTPTYIWQKPGVYNATLVTIDWVGHRSYPAKLRVTVNDTKAPTPNFIILDPSNDWAVTTNLVEGKAYAFNGNSSSDDYDSNVNLTYTWGFPGPIASATPSLNSTGNFTGKGAAGWNVTVTWSVFNTSYNVTLKVTDTGFPFGTGSGKENSAVRVDHVAVSVDTPKHPDLKYVAGSFRVTPSQPQEGESINVSFEIENVAGRLNASDVRVILYTRDSGGNLVPLSSQPNWYNDDWSTGSPAADKMVRTGGKVRFTFAVSFPDQGNHTLEAQFQDAKEPYTWNDAQNKVVGSVFVNLANWKIPALFAVVIIAIIGVILGLRAYSRYKAGEPIFGSREKKEKKKLGKEEEEEEEDRKGKKRL